MEPKIVTLHSGPSVKDKLIFLGDGLIPVPYSLVFDSELSSLDVRIWMAFRILYEEDRVISFNELNQFLKMTYEEINESLAMLEMMGWVVMRYKNNMIEQPIVSTRRMTFVEMQIQNSQLKNNLDRYLKSGTDRMIKAAKILVSRLGSDD